MAFPFGFGRPFFVWVSYGVVAFAAYWGGAAIWFAVRTGRVREAWLDVRPLVGLTLAWLVFEIVRRSTLAAAGVLAAPFAASFYFGWSEWRRIRREAVPMREAIGPAVAIFLCGCVFWLPILVSNPLLYPPEWQKIGIALMPSALLAWFGVARLQRSPLNDPWSTVSLSFLAGMWFSFGALLLALFFSMCFPSPSHPICLLFERRPAVR